METYAFILYCTLFSLVVAFTVPEYNVYNSSASEIAESQDCKCKNGRCVTDSRGNTKCNCRPGYALQDEHTCEPCDCGKKGKCIFIPQAKSAGGFLYVKKCLCDIGSAEKDGVCVDCHCGENSKCEFEGDEKICYCIEKYVEKNGVCTECDCGFYGECSFKNGKKACACDPGFKEDNGYCKEDFCDKNCGLEPGVVCLGDRFSEDVQCLCSNRDNSFDVMDKKCKEDFCRKYCGLDTDVLCKGNRFSPMEVHCGCQHEEYAFDKENKKCRENFCVKKCGWNSGVVCEGDMFNEWEVTCGCKNRDYSFDVMHKECREDFCRKRCGSHPTVRCVGNIFSKWEVQCKCHSANSSFDNIDKKCRECDCGKYSLGCNFEGGKKTCQCRNDDVIKTADNQGKCVECTCGKYSHGCKFVNAWQVCDCHNGYVQVGGMCEMKCSNKLPCQHGGRCNEKGICECLPGTRGHYCEVIEACDRLCPIQRDINCTYDIRKQKAYCKCLNEGMSYYPELRKCRRTCNEYSVDCKNSGSCEIYGDSRFCKCLDGTNGDFCEIIPQCDTMDCGSEATCIYDAFRRSAACKCHEDIRFFDPQDRKCKRQCRDSSDCKNGANCEGSDSATFCRCPKGTHGDFCEIFPECETKDCGTDAQCVYYKGTARCMCKAVDFHFDSRVKKCRQTCSYSSPCKNGGTCEMVDSMGRNLGFCRCLKGTEGDHCDKVTECERKDCGYEAQCRYSVESKAAKCMCKNNELSFDVYDKTCKKSCSDKEMCRNGGDCKRRGDHNFCICRKGTSGDFCEKVDICKDTCGSRQDVICKYNINEETVSCLCKDPNYAFDEASKMCKKQKCTDRKCINGKCQVINDKEVCTCYEGYFLDGDECKTRTCKKTPCLNGTCIVRHGGEEECICPSGYTLKNDICIRGLCRPDTCFGGKCQIIQGELTCVCPDRFHLEGVGCYETVCVIQRCFGGKCVVENDEEICTCKEGYKLVNDVCKKILCEEKNCFGGQCHLIDGKEECTCPAGFSLFEDVCRENQILQ